jgi:NAD+ diphosphatase
MEEVGLKVKNIRYYKSQPWSFSDTLLLGFYAELDGDPTITLDEEELSEAVWMDRDKIDVEFDNLSLTNEMIVHFKNRN